MFMYNPWFHKYPGTNFHEQNIDWIVKQIKILMGEMKDFEAVNQIRYIGVWDITEQYGPWNVVTYNNDGYISLQPVPSGIAITNLDYWRKISDYTAEMADLQNRVQNLETDVTTINNKIPTYDIDHIKIVNKWSSRKIIFVGDSYGRGRTYPGIYSTSWCDEVESRLSPAAAYNMSVSSAAFGSSVTDSLRFGYQIKTFKDSHTAAECEAITDIVIAGGINELFNPSDDLVGSNADYCPGWTANYINTYFPNATVYMGFIGRSPNFVSNANFSFSNLTDCIQKYKDVCTKYHWHYIINSEYMGHDYSDLTSDGIHFKTAGYIKIGGYIAEYLNNGTWDIPQQSGAALTFDTISAGTGRLPVESMTGLYNQLTKDGVQIFNNATINFKFAQDDIEQKAGYDLFYYFHTSAEVFNKFSMQYDRRIPINYVITDGNYSVLSDIIQGYLTFKSDGFVHIECISGTPTKTCTAAEHILIPALNVTFPLSVC